MNDREIIRLEQFRQLKKEIREGDKKGFVQNVHNAPTGAFTCWGTRDFSPILKDERRTSNIQRPTSNEKQTSNTEHSTAMYDSHRILKQPFFKVISLFLHLFPFNIRCWTFDVRCSSFFSLFWAKTTQRLWGFRSDPNYPTLQSRLL